jgi:cytochrome P450 family 110
VGEPFRLLETMQSLTLTVILEAVFGYEPGPERDELRARVRALIEPLARPRGIVILNALMRGRRNRPAMEFEARKRAIDELLYAEI